jgi:hypothetical protein
MFQEHLVIAATGCDFPLMIVRGSPLYTACCAARRNTIAAEQLLHSVLYLYKTSFSPSWLYCSSWCCV